MDDSGKNERRLTQQDIDDAKRLLAQLDARRFQKVSKEPSVTHGSTKQAGGEHPPRTARLRYLGENENGHGGLQSCVFSHQKSRESQNRGGSVPCSGDDTAADRAGTSTPRVFK